MASATDLGVDSVLDTITGLFGLTGDEYGPEFKVLCPNPNHDDHNPSCTINLDTGYWVCHPCGAGGDLLDLGKLALGKPQREIREMLEPRTPEAMLVNLRNRLARIGKKQTDQVGIPLHLPGPYEPAYHHPELLARGFKPSTLEKWDVRFAPAQVLQGNKGEFTIRNSIAIPIRDERGKLLAWCYRATKESPQWQQDNVRYLYTPEFPISEVWFGQHIHNHTNTDNITVVEGGLDAMWLDQCGFPAWALLGSNMGNLKIRRLQAFRYATLFPDRDSSGAVWVNRIGGELGNLMPLYIVRYDTRIMETYLPPDKPNAKVDPEMLAAIDVEWMMYRSITWTKFIRSTT